MTGGRRGILFMKLRASLLVFLLACTSAAGSTRVWIDTDPSIGAPWREVDDAFALAFAFHSPELRITGISTTYGNAGLQRTTAVTRALVSSFGAVAGIEKTDVHSGASGAGDPSTKTAATDALAHALRKGRLTYIALGPLTNLACFLEVHPALAHRIERVLFVGGKSPDYELVFGRNGWLRIHDANVFKDPAAVRRVLESDIPLVLLPVETSSHLVLERELGRKLRDGGPAARFLHAKSRVWQWFWTSIVHHRGGPLFDSLAILLASKPDLVRIHLRHAAVRGNELIATHQPAGDSRPVGFATKVSLEGERLAVERLRQAPTE